MGRAGNVARRAVRSAFVACLCALGLAGAGFAAAAVLGGGQAESATITACIQKASGAVRIPVVGACQPQETTLEWSRSGAPGPAGPPGADGHDGAPGLTQVVTIAGGGACGTASGWLLKTSAGDFTVCNGTNGASGTVTVEEHFTTTVFVTTTTGSESTTTGSQTPPQLASLTVTRPAGVSGSVDITVSLDKPATGDTTVVLITQSAKSSCTGTCLDVGQIVIPNGQTSALMPAATSPDPADYPMVIRALLNGVIRTATLDFG